MTIHFLSPRSNFVLNSIGILTYEMQPRIFICDIFGFLFIYCSLGFTSCIATLEALLRMFTPMITAST